MGRINWECLGGENVYLCKKCNNYLTNHENLISDKFRGQSGTAFLFKLVVNIDMFEIEKKPMTTGYHMVRDIGCKCCKTRIGWVYEFAFENSQEYKEGHFIIEKSYIVLVNGLPGDNNFIPEFSRRQPSIYSSNFCDNAMIDNNSSYSLFNNINIFNRNPNFIETTTNSLLQQFDTATLQNIMNFTHQTVGLTVNSINLPLFDGESLSINSSSLINLESQSQSYIEPELNSNNSRNRYGFRLPRHPVIRNYNGNQSLRHFSRRRGSR